MPRPLADRQEPPKSARESKPEPAADSDRRFGSGECQDIGRPGVVLLPPMAERAVVMGESMDRNAAVDYSPLAPIPDGYWRLCTAG